MITFQRRKSDSVKWHQMVSKRISRIDLRTVQTGSWILNISTQSLSSFYVFTIPLFLQATILSSKYNLLSLSQKLSVLICQEWISEPKWKILLKNNANFAILRSLWKSLFGALKGFLKSGNRKDGFKEICSAATFHSWNFPKTYLFYSPYLFKGICLNTRAEKSIWTLASS